MADLPDEYSRKVRERKTFELFLKSRKNDQTRAYALAILECLSDQFDKDLQYRVKNLSEREIESGVSSTRNIGWVRTKELLERVKKIPDESSTKNIGGAPTKELIKNFKIIPNESTFFQLLKNLSKAKLIQKKIEHNPGLAIEPGKPPVYYRVPGVYSRYLFKSKEDLERDLRKLEQVLIHFNLLFFAAECLLKECHKNDPNYDPRKEILKETKRLFKLR